MTQSYWEEGREVEAGEKVNEEMGPFLEEGEEVRAVRELARNVFDLE